MNRSVTLLLLTSLSLILTACQASSAIAPPATGPAAMSSLDGLSTWQTIHTKYNGAKLHCQLGFSLKTAGESATQTTWDTMDWDLARQFSDSKDITLKTNSGGVNIEVEMQLEMTIEKDIDLLNGIEEPADDKDVDYSMHDTPKITATINFKSDSSYVEDSNPNATATFYENIEGTALNLENNQATDPYSIQVTCLLGTNPKPTYANQWVKHD